MCEKKVQKRRKKAKRSSDAEDDDSDDSDGGGGTRPERVRRWDHLRKIHRIIVCSGCEMHLPKQLLQGHLSVCPGRS